MKKSLSFIMLLSIVALAISFQGCNSCSSYDSSKYDDEYWKSVNREKSLKDAGLDNAASMEKEARRDRLDGGGYTKPDGSGTQTHYQGSKQQKDDLDAIDRYAKENPDFW